MESLCINFNLQLLQASLVFEKLCSVILGSRDELLTTLHKVLRDIFYHSWTVILILHISNHVSQNTALCTDTYEILFSSLKNVTFSVT